MKIWNLKTEFNIDMETLKKTSQNETKIEKIMSCLENSGKVLKVERINQRGEYKASKIKKNV